MPLCRWKRGCEPILSRMFSSSKKSKLLTLPRILLLEESSKSVTSSRFGIPLLSSRSTNPARSTDAGPGMEVPGDSTSHGRDSVNVSGHAIPAVLYSNQYAVLYDMEPTEMEDLDGLIFELLEL